ncbi:uncharacterized protein BXZ73DRAFT_77982 [Epithele typhae]|uniref:uncharacterized protein n=1 Tax=Epithele typhae TaxID=378194 RepID=UPI002008C965|nr:uncharacterized protein BXZ73DRAFT_77982 [Epithele typhae]KAH9929861.1 hypothetical protein BXZ73DRAFT_77982 [Epithele typhae]
MTGIPRLQGRHPHCLPLCNYVTSSQRPTCRRGNFGSSCTVPRLSATGHRIRLDTALGGGGEPRRIETDSDQHIAPARMSERIWLVRDLVSALASTCLNVSSHMSLSHQIVFPPLNVHGAELQRLLIQCCGELTASCLRQANAKRRQARVCSNVLSRFPECAISVVQGRVLCPEHQKPLRAFICYTEGQHLGMVHASCDFIVDRTTHKSCGFKLLPTPKHLDPDEKAWIIQVGEADNGPPPNEDADDWFVTLERRGMKAEDRARSLQHGLDTKEVPSASDQQTYDEIFAKALAYDDLPKGDSPKQYSDTDYLGKAAAYDAFQFSQSTASGSPSTSFGASSPSLRTPSSGQIPRRKNTLIYGSISLGRSSTSERSQMARRMSDESPLKNKVHQGKNKAVPLKLGRHLAIGCEPADVEEDGKDLDDFMDMSDGEQCGDEGHVGQAAQAAQSYDPGAPSNPIELTDDSSSGNERPRKMARMKTNYANSSTVLERAHNVLSRTKSYTNIVKTEPLDNDECLQAAGRHFKAASSVKNSPDIVKRNKKLGAPSTQRGLRDAPSALPPSARGLRDAPSAPSTQRDSRDAPSAPSAKHGSRDDPPPAVSDSRTPGGCGTLSASPGEREQGDFVASVNSGTERGLLYNQFLLHLQSRFLHLFRFDIEDDEPPFMASQDTWQLTIYYHFFNGRSLLARTQVIPHAEHELCVRDIRYLTEFCGVFGESRVKIKGPGDARWMSCRPSDVIQVSCETRNHIRVAMMGVTEVKETTDDEDGLSDDDVDNSDLFAWREGSDDDLLTVEEIKDEYGVDGGDGDGFVEEDSFVEEEGMDEDSNE